MEGIECDDAAFNALSTFKKVHTRKCSFKKKFLPNSASKVANCRYSYVNCMLSLANSLQRSVKIE